MTKTAPKSHVDIYQQITQQIISAIEAGTGSFQMPWHSDGGSLRPLNASTGKPYRGINILALWSAADERGYSSDRWATYKQWSEMGAQVRKGEKSSHIVFWKINEDREGDESAEDGEEAHRSIIARGYGVFNALQVDGYDIPPTPPRPEMQRVQQAEQFFSALGAEIKHGGNRAFYQPASDTIQMPNFESFRDAVSYYSVLAHETTHWTGAKPRLDRDLSGRFGNEAYAAEELVAELGAAFLTADLGLTNEPRSDHAAYVATWLKVLKDDKRAIFTAAAKAQRAADYAHGLQPQLDPEPEPERKAPDKKGQFTLGF